MLEMTVKTALFDIRVEGADERELWRKAAFWQDLPTVCPVDGSPVRFGYANRGGFDYYYLESTGERRYEFQFGQSLEDKSLFPGRVEKVGKDKVTVRKWTYWDGEKAVTVWENGKLVGTVSTVSPSTLAGNGKQAYTKVEHRTVRDEAELDAVVNEALANGTGVTQDDGNPFDEPGQRGGVVFRWPTDGDELALCADLINYDVPLSAKAKTLINWATKMHNESGEKKLSTSTNGKSQYGYLVSLIDGVCGKGSHRSVLSALCGAQISQQNPPGWKLKHLIDHLVEREANVLDGLGSVANAIKEAMAEVAA